MAQSGCSIILSGLGLLNISVLVSFHVGFILMLALSLILFGPHWSGPSKLGFLRKKSWFCLLKEVGDVDRMEQSMSTPPYLCSTISQKDGREKNVNSEHF